MTNIVPEALSSNSILRDRTQRICTRCVMDTTDPDIIFDEEGVCNHCHSYDDQIHRHVFSGELGKAKVFELAEKIKKEGKGKPYDCIIGLSGGVDSTFTAYTVKKLGLRPLAVHLDNGWDSALAVKNIESALKTLSIDLYTHVLDWNEYRDLQLAFIKASTPDLEIPTDHAIVALLYDVARSHRVRYVISGCNARTESHLPPAWSQGHWDWGYIKTVAKLSGVTQFKSYPHMNFFRYHWNLRHCEWIDILNFIDYVKRDALKILEDQLGWTNYGGKHFESIYTRFYQGYFLLKKFGFDKRKCHLSSLICSGEITREYALKELEKSTYPMEIQKQDFEYVAKKFRISEAELNQLIALPKKSYWEYASYGKFQKTFLFRILQILFRWVTRSTPTNS